LITTADERTWPRGRRVLFLGEWARLYSRRSAWKDLDAEVVPYHWDDREKLARDYLNLNVLYEELLRELAEQLNRLHQVDHSVRYWRILIGPWLGYFVPVLFDRWSMLECAVGNYSVAGVRALETPPEQLIPSDMGQFVDAVCTDAWNEGIWTQLLEDWWPMAIEKSASTDAPGRRPAPATEKSLLRQSKRTVARAISLLMQPLTRRDEAFFISSYLPFWQDLRLQWRLGQVPKVWTTGEMPRSLVDWGKRRWKLRQAGGADFSNVVRAMIPRHIPTLYVEGYAALNRACSLLPWPHTPRLIFTSNAFMTDDMFKAWAAEKVEHGAPFVIGQHGGQYGVALFTFPEYHQRAISDRWLSWGWREETTSKVRPVGNIKLVGKKLGWDPNGHALMVEMGAPRYSGILYSVPLASQWLDYFEFQCRFVTRLPEHLRAAVLVRLNLDDYQWDQAGRWRDRFPDIHIDSGGKPIARLIERCRIYVSTYNATTFLESLALNIPTIMFWNAAHFELRASARPDFEKLKSVGIFHETPEAAAQQMAAVWDDVSSWWNTERIQSVRREFCDRYTRTSTGLLDDLERALREAM